VSIKHTIYDIEWPAALIIDDVHRRVDEVVGIKNYADHDEPLFKARARKKRLEHIVLHETAGRTAIGCKRTLLRRGYGVHLIIDRDGTISQHGDLRDDVMVHANQCNPTSIGIEIVNPYAPSIARGMDVDTMGAQWWTWCPDPRDRRYVLPTPAQLGVLEKIVPWLCKTLQIPLEFPTRALGPAKRKIKGWRLKKRPAPGIVAHRDFATHADGRYPLEWLIDRRSK